MAPCNSGRLVVEKDARIVARCRAKVAPRQRRIASAKQLSQGVPLFVEQLTRTLRAEKEEEDAESLRISGASGGDAIAVSEIGRSATAQGRMLLDLGFKIDQALHDYGDLCQAVTDLGFERDAPFSINEFRTLNRCLDNAIADAVTGFAEQRDTAIALRNPADENQRLGFLVHELRNHLQTASLAFAALESGKLAVGGSTAALIKRSHASLGALLTESISEVRLSAHHLTDETFSMTSMVVEVTLAASLYALASGCTLAVPMVDPRLTVSGNRALLTAALLNLLQTAFKFTRTSSAVTLTAYEREDRVLTEVQDQCGSLPIQNIANLFRPFEQAGEDKTGLGLRLSIASRSVEADGGSLRVRDLPGVACIFTIDLPLKTRLQ